ncbi:MAG: dTMP kinase [Myxococcota bacterium]
MRGKLIAFEGIDGAGKTTQARRLVHALVQRGRPATYTKEPTDGPDGRRLRASARAGRLPAEEELALFVRDRQAHVRELILPALAQGVTVVVDRYFPSTAAYQGARGLDPAAILAQNEAFAPAPDLGVWIDVEPAVGLARVRGRDAVENLFEQLGDLERCREVFRAIERPWWRRFDGALEPDVLAAQITAAVDAC